VLWQLGRGPARVPYEYVADLVEMRSAAISDGGLQRREATRGLISGPVIDLARPRWHALNIARGSVSTRGP